LPGHLAAGLLIGVKLCCRSWESRWTRLNPRASAASTAIRRRGAFSSARPAARKPRHEPAPFHKSRTPLVKWFLAIHLLTSAKNDIAALELARQLGVKWDTAWLIKQKLMEVMLQRNATYKLGGEVQIDDAYLGGEKAGSPFDRGSFAIDVALRILVVTRVRGLDRAARRHRISYRMRSVGGGS